MPIVLFRTFLTSAGVKTIRFHGLRHTHASILLASGVDVVKVNTRLGHANPKITLQVYAHIIPHGQDDVPDIFEEAMENSKKEEC